MNFSVGTIILILLAFTFQAIAHAEDGTNISMLRLRNKITFDPSFPAGPSLLASPSANGRGSGFLCKVSEKDFVKANQIVMHSDRNLGLPMGMVITKVDGIVKSLDLIAYGNSPSTSGGERVPLVISSKGECIFTGLLN